MYFQKKKKMEETLFISVDGEQQPIDTTHFCFGKEPTRLVICVPGKNGVKESFHQFLHDLVEKQITKDVLVLTYTLFGKRGSGGHLDHESIQRQSEVLEQLVLTLQQKYPTITVVDAVAHSMGCAIASKAASRNPALFHRIVYLTPMFRMKGMYAWIPVFIFMLLRWIGSILPIGLQPYGDAMLNTSCLERRKAIATSRSYETHSLFDSADALVEANRFLSSEHVPNECLVITAGLDTTVCNEGAKEFCSRDPILRTYLCYPNARHSIHNEIKELRIKVVEAICSFLNL